MSDVGMYYEKEHLGRQSSIIFSGSLLSECRQPFTHRLDQNYNYVCFRQKFESIDHVVFTSYLKTTGLTSIRARMSKIPHLPAQDNALNL